GNAEMRGGANRTGRDAEMRGLPDRPLHNLAGDGMAKRQTAVEDRDCAALVCSREFMTTRDRAGTQAAEVVGRLQHTVGRDALQLRLDQTVGGGKRGLRCCAGSGEEIGEEIASALRRGRDLADCTR